MDWGQVWIDWCCCSLIEVNSGGWCLGDPQMHPICVVNTMDWIGVSWHRMKIGSTVVWCRSAGRIILFWQGLMGWWQLVWQWSGGMIYSRLLLEGCSSGSGWWDGNSLLVCRPCLDFPWCKGTRNGTIQEQIQAKKSIPIYFNLADFPMLLSSFLDVDDGYMDHIFIFQIVAIFMY